MEEKLALVAQMADCGNICELARRHDLRPSQLFTWRRELRYAASAVQGANQGQSNPMFVPTVIEPVAPPASKRKPVRRTHPAPVPVVELEIDGVAVRIARGADGRASEMAAEREKTATPGTSAATAPEMHLSGESATVLSYMQPAAHRANGSGPAPVSAARLPGA